jgi:hypothetical protein
VGCAQRRNFVYSGFKNEAVGRYIIMDERREEEETFGKFSMSGGNGEILRKVALMIGDWQAPPEWGLRYPYPVLLNFICKTSKAAFFQCSIHYRMSIAVIYSRV